MADVEGEVNGSSVMTAKARSARKERKAALKVPLITEKDG